MISKRMKLRALETSDADLLFKWYQQKETMEYLYNERLDLSIEDHKARIINQKNTEKLLMLTLLDGKPIGECYYSDILNTSCKVGIKICDQDYLSKGYGKEGMQMLIAHLFGGMGFKIVFLEVFEANKIALKLFKSIGFKISSHQSDFFVDQVGQKHGVVFMTLTVDAFRSALKVPFKMA